MAEETSRAARTAADVGENATLAGAEMIQRNIETAEQAWQSGTEWAKELTERSMDQFARAFGITGESAQHARQQSSRNLDAMVQSGAIVTSAFQGIAREWLEFARKRMQENLGRAEALANCRTPQEFLAAQSDLLRDNLEDFAQSTRRMAEISMQMADEAVRKMTESSLAPR